MVGAMKQTFKNSPRGRFVLKVVSDVLFQRLQELGISYEEYRKADRKQSTELNRRIFSFQVVSTRIYPQIPEAHLWWADITKSSIADELTPDFSGWWNLWKRGRGMIRNVLYKSLHEFDWVDGTDGKQHQVWRGKENEGPKTYDPGPVVTPLNITVTSLKSSDDPRIGLTREEERAQLHKQDYKCFNPYCKVPVTTSWLGINVGAAVAHFDHFIPRGASPLPHLLDGKHNQVAMCGDCNLRKGTTPGPDFILAEEKRAKLPEKAAATVV